MKDAKEQTIEGYVIGRLIRTEADNESLKREISELKDRVDSLSVENTILKRNVKVIEPRVEDGGYRFEMFVTEYDDGYKALEAILLGGAKE